ncbi:MAG TPA: hypothetical protein VE035_12565 [Puia sp.]|nr:hypothetical protein [Puia sp.]
MKKHLILPAVLLFIVNSLIAQTNVNAQSVHLVDKQLSLTSTTFTDEASQCFVGLDAGDKITLNCYRMSKTGNISILIKDFSHGNEIYKREGFDSIRNESINIATKGIYIVSLKTSSLLGKDVRLMVDRIPSSNGGPAATADHKPSSDTTSMEILNTTARAYSKNSPQANNLVFKLNLPPNTTYWIYWIGVGKDAREKMKAFTASCSTVGSLFPTNPLVLYGMKQIPVLPMSVSNAAVGYHFMDTKNTDAFRSRQQYSFYMFKSSDKITTEYASIHNAQSDLNLAILNTSMNTDQDVEVRVVAFIVKPK